VFSCFGGRGHREEEEEKKKGSGPQKKGAHLFLPGPDVQYMITTTAFEGLISASILTGTFEWLEPDLSVSRACWWLLPFQKKINLHEGLRILKKRELISSNSSLLSTSILSSLLSSFSFTILPSVSPAG